MDLKIDDPELQKEDEVRCPHLMTGRAGCSIYERRPLTCRNWVCGWRILPFSDALRPDLCGIMLVPEMTEVPGYAKGGLKIVFTDSQPPKPLPDELLDFAGQMVASNVPLFLAYGRGAFGKRLLVNDLLKPMVKAGDRTGFVNAMNTQLRRLTEQVRAGMAHSGT